MSGLPSEDESESSLNFVGIPQSLEKLVDVGDIAFKIRSSPETRRDLLGSTQGGWDGPLVLEQSHHL